MENLINIIKDKIQFSKIECGKLITRNYYDVTYEYIIKNILKTNPIKIINNILPYITTTETIKKIDLQCDDIGEGRYERSEIYSSLNLDEFYKITEIELGKCGILEHDGKELSINDGYDFRIDFNRVLFNSYSSSVEIRGIFEGESYIMSTLDDSLIAVELYITGIKKETIVPSWIEYIIEGLFNINYDNYKMAFFNICAGFDNFINDVYDDIFDYYIEYYSKCNNENVKLKLKEKIRLFANKEKRLRSKLVQIFKELKMNEKDGFKDLQSFFDIWDKKYVKIRDKIAHGGLYEEEFKLEEVSYVILTIIFSILLHEDCAANNWKSIIEFDSE